MIKKLILTNFRKFKNIKLDFDKPLIIIHGDNAKGKSSILEAIYTLTNGHSPWASFDDIFENNQQEELNFRIEADIEIEDEMKNIAFFKNENKRVLQIEKQNTTSKKFFEKISSTIFNPEQIEILMISSSKRREFLDEILSKIDIEYTDILKKHRQTLRQRNAYLKKLSKVFFETGKFNEKDTQLMYWTKEFAKYSARIIAKRNELASELETEKFKIKYNSTLSLNLFEDMMDISSLEKIHFKVMMDKVKRDIAVGHTKIGAHRDDWSIHNGQDVKRFGSRGEKRMAIVELIFLTQTLVAKKKGQQPYLLLDDIPSELDSSNIGKILNKEILGKQQTFITTIDISLIPKDIKKDAQIINLNS